MSENYRGLKNVVHKDYIEELLEKWYRDVDEATSEAVKTEPPDSSGYHGKAAGIEHCIEDLEELIDG